MHAQSLFEWAPFRIDALGLVTIIGADEFNRSTGRLVRNCYTDYLPFLGGYVIAGDLFVKPLPGLTLYNITDGIMSTDLAGWFSLWLVTQNLSWSNSTMVLSVQNVAHNELHTDYISGFIGFITNTSLLMLAMLIWDWFGLANALMMILSVLVRTMLIKQNREAIDRNAFAYLHSGNDVVKTVIVLSNGKAVTVFASRSILVHCVLMTPPPKPWLYKLCQRYLYWPVMSFYANCISISNGHSYCHYSQRLWK
jgi:hypothetical protein